MEQAESIPAALKMALTDLGIAREQRDVAYERRDAALALERKHRLLADQLSRGWQQAEREYSDRKRAWELARKRLHDQNAQHWIDLAKAKNLAKHMIAKVLRQGAENAQLAKELTAATNIVMRVQNLLNELDKEVNVMSIGPHDSEQLAVFQTAARIGVKLRRAIDG